MLFLTTLVLSVWSFWLLTISLKFAYSHSYKVRNNSCQVLSVKHCLKGMTHLLRVFARNVSLRLADKAAAVSCSLLLTDNNQSKLYPLNTDCFDKKASGSGKSGRCCPSSTQPHTRSEKQSAGKQHSLWQLQTQTWMISATNKKKIKFIPLVPLQSNYRMTILTKK